MIGSSRNTEKENIASVYAICGLSSHDQEIPSKMPTKAPSNFQLQNNQPTRFKECDITISNRTQA